MLYHLKAKNEVNKVYGNIITNRKLPSIISDNTLNRNYHFFSIKCHNKVSQLQEQTYESNFI
jgi:hypothetical protein